ncbi:Tfp pilus assembly protein PilF [Thermanaeromonas toyohensis ToBE]|uniref:Tfp pilus assembly protein PilF n=1 Tax=Thermanaeromonas toyohensis ToBE TaxID=698762 RepID=A0A1W1VXS8_9FIRM|nr:O-antigen ligase family protein [Thermanaeromonas toyohensis]SMB98146.1 Tfp pilus assembly protein PilF [Thermanaeromonas toyohensis ToBE]
MPDKKETMSGKAGTRKVIIKLTGKEEWTQRAKEKQPRGKESRVLTKGGRTPKKENRGAGYHGLVFEGNSLLWYLSFSALLLLLFYPPFFRGLFFPVEQRWTLILATLAFVLTWLWKFSRREVGFLKSPLDYATLAMVMVYILSSLQPASRHLALAEVSKVTLYFLVFWLIVQLNRNQLTTSWILHSLYGAGIGVSLAGLLTATGIIYIKDGFVGGRIYSTLQYPNALAAYLMGISFLGFYLWGRAGNLPRLFYAAGNYLLLMVFLGTGSRGAYLVYPSTLTLYFLLTPKGSRLGFLAHLVATSVCALVGNRFLSLAVAQKFTGAWKWFFLGLALAVGLQVLGLGAVRVLSSTRAYLVKLAALSILVLVAGIYAYSTVLTPAASVQGGSQVVVWEKFLPSQITQRIKDINLETKSSRERMEWTLDALRMLKERPLLGYGGGGWEAAYRQYQRYFYNSTQVHNYYAQLAVETGLVGITVIAALWLFFLFTAVKNYLFYQGEHRLLIASLLAGALSLGLHAALDFDLALGAVSILLWSFWGLMRSLERWRRQEETLLSPREFSRVQVKYISAVALAALFILVFSASFLAGTASAQEGLQAYQRGNLRVAASKLEEALKYDPFMASYAADLASIYLREGRNAEALKLALQAIKQEPYNYLLRMRLAEVYWALGEVEEAVAALKKARDLAPWVASTWENLARGYVAGGIWFLQQNQLGKAKEFFSEVLAMPPEIEQRLKLLGDLEKLHNEKPGGLNFTPALHLEVGKAQYFLGQGKEAMENLTLAAQRKDLEPEVKLWKALVLTQQGQSATANRLLEELQKSNPELAAQFTQIQRLPGLQTVRY